MLCGVTILGLHDLAACGPAHAPSPAPFSIVIGTDAHLSPVTPLVRDGFTPAILGLVYAPLDRYFDRAATLAPDRILLHLKPDSALSLETLAPLIHDPELTVEPRADGLLLTFKHPTLVVPYFELGWHMVDSGPYELVHHDDASLVFARRAGDGPAQVTVKHFGTEDEVWRRFLAHEIDLVPQVSASALHLLGELKGVRIERLPSEETVALAFNVGTAQLGDVRLRQAIALGLNRRSMAEAVNAEPARAVELSPHDEARARALLEQVSRERGGPVKLHLLVVDAVRSFTLAAVVAQSQLRALGIQVELETLPLSELVARVAKRDFDAALFYSGSSHMYLLNSLSHAVGNASGYENATYDAAIAHGDDDAARAILLRDVPVTLLFRDSVSIVLDGHLCGGAPHIASDLSWLADLRWCGP